MTNKDYIPQNTHDLLAVKRLKDLPFEVVREDIPKLLEWLQDAHWEVAEGIADYLVSHVNDITQELLVIFNTADGMRKYCVISILIPRSSID